MNLMERNHHTDENEKREQEHGILYELVRKPFMTPVLLGVIAVLLICIIVLLVFMPNSSRPAQAGTDSDLQQNIADYANQQKQNDHVPGVTGETVTIELVDEESTENTQTDADTEYNSESEYTTVAADTGKNAVVIDEEDETDVSYSKEYILNEAFPYFVDNKQDAIWDLAHLKRYVKLSEELKDTNQYYYKGEVNSSGKPNGKGLAIYEDNSYYYGDWSNGVRSGGGTWFRFYINEKSARNAMGKYTAHSYSGEWANDLPNGQGAEHFDVDNSKLEGSERIVQNVVGNFTDGLYDGEMFANTVDHKKGVQEWDGIVTNGVFSLWRDMSAIGECSVWRNKDDHNLCLDIDKSENKNQGMRELLKTDTE